MSKQTGDEIGWAELQGLKSQQKNTEGEVRQISKDLQALEYKVNMIIGAPSLVCLTIITVIAYLKFHKRLK